MSSPKGELLERSAGGGEARSLGDMLRRTAQRFPDRVALQTDVEITYGDLVLRVRKVAQALHDLGLARGDRLAIFSENSPMWATVDWAAQCLGVVTVPIYPTLTADQAQFILRDCGASLCLCGSEETLKRAQGPGLPDAMLLSGAAESLEAKLGAEMPAEEWGREIDSTMPDDLATIIYTSGTTGEPKGAMLPHRAFTFLAHSALASLPVGPDDVFLSFLPLSHVFERFAGHVLPISLGARIAYAKSLASLAADMVRVKPTVMLVVPRFLEATMDKMEGALQKQSPLKRKLVEIARKANEAKMAGKFAPLAGLFDSLALEKLRARLGGRLRFFVSGGAALPPHVAAFYKSLGIDILQGYGLTETCAASSVNHPDRNKFWTVGEPLHGMEVRIAPDGEILIRGPGVMRGYYNLPEATSEAIDGEGWFHTGDIGEFEGAHLKITDRKKDILVLANGKNVAPLPIESKLKASRFIAEAVVLGDGLDSCAALIVPAEEAIRAELRIAADVPIAGKPEVRAVIKREIDAVNRTLAGYEWVKKFEVLDRPFSIEAGEITPTLKVKRKVIKERYADKIASMK